MGLGEVGSSENSGGSGSPQMIESRNKDRNRTQHAGALWIAEPHLVSSAEPVRKLWAGEMAHPSTHNGGPPIEDERAGNWFAVSRTIFDHPVVGIRNRPYTELEAWLSLLAMAEYENRRVMNKGEVVVLDPGQLMAAHIFLAKRWDWSQDKVRYFLQRLANEAMITRFCNTQNANRRTNQIQIITICNYSKYQMTDGEEHQANYHAVSQASTKPAPSAHQANTTNLTLKHTNTPTQESSVEDLSADADAPLLDEPSPKQKQNHYDALQAFNAYNELAQKIGLSLARSLTPQRRKNLMARLREHGGLDAWQIALNNIERSAFLRGSNPKGWVANFDFMLQASSFAKLVDGVYGNGAHAAGAPGHHVESNAERWARMAAESGSKS